MGEKFVFEAASDDEIENEVEEVEAKPSQSPWEFAAYSESVAEEHARRSTTSIDEKISKLREERSIPVPDDIEDDDDSDVEPDKQVSLFYFCLSFQFK